MANSYTALAKFYEKIIYDNEYKKLSIDESLLLDDMIEIYRYVEFTIMEKRYNSALGNSVIATPPLGADIG